MNKKTISTSNKNFAWLNNVSPEKSVNEELVESIIFGAIESYGSTHPQSKTQDQFREFLMQEMDPVQIANIDNMVYGFIHKSLPYLRGSIQEKVESTESLYIRLRSLAAKVSCTVVELDRAYKAWMKKYMEEVDYEESLN
jgi:hypothetical protein